MQIPLNEITAQGALDSALQKITPSGGTDTYAASRWVFLVARNLHTTDDLIVTIAQQSPSDQGLTDDIVVTVPPQDARAIHADPRLYEDAQGQIRVTTSHTTAELYAVAPR